MIVEELMNRKNGPYTRAEIIMSYYSSLETKEHEDSTNYKNKGLEEKTVLFDPNDIWKSTYHRNMVKLALMILLYLFSNDDDIITKKELNRIKKLNKRQGKYLSKTERKEILQLASHKMTLSSFLDYISKNEYQELIFNDACSLSKTIIKGNVVYINILEELKQKFNSFKF